MEKDPDTLLNQNLDYVKKHASWRTISAIERALAARAVPSLRIENGTAFYAGEILLHSRRGPELEAKEQLDKWIAGENPALDGMVTVLGAGGLYHIIALGRRMKARGLLFIADLFPENFIELMRNLKLKNIFSSGGPEVVFSVSSSPDEIAHDFRVRLSERSAMDSSFFMHPGTFRVWRAPSEALFGQLINEYSLEAMNRKTRAFYGPDWHRNTTLNMAYSFTCPRIDSLKDIFKDKTAIVAAAGPSLNEAIPYIRQLADNAVIIAPGTAIKPLLEAGIVPDLTVAVDCSPNVFKQYARADHPDIFLVADTIVMPELFDKFRGRTFLFSSDSVPDVSGLLASFGMLPARMASGGTVSLSAIETALYLGCTEIILCGLDLAVSEDGMSHAIGTVYDGKKCEENELVETEGNSGNKVLTTRQFKSYIDVMRSYFGNPANTCGINFVNASPTGARIGPIRVCSASEIPDSAGFKSISGAKKSLIRENYVSASKKIEEDLRGAEFFASALRELSSLKILSLKASGFAASIKEKYAKAQDTRSALAMLESSENEIKKHKNALRLVNTALRRALESLFSHGAGTPSEAMGKSAELYSEMSDASAITYDFLAESAQKYDELKKI
ncbi:MAG: hypothetical protein A2020_01580 [Lentisphaerae bacterium GWF2_45_14]|nr:MAG: hypothetical protein A2020_01580 [Lentisphaerae bacterium GWF2_45_14]